MRRLRTIALNLTIGTAFFAAGVGVTMLFADEPQIRRIHIDLFRYGSQPEVIHANRGDRLVFTFSARDTPHSFFLQEYDLDVKVSPNSREVEVARPSDPHGEPEVMKEVVVEAGRPGLAGFFNTKSRFRCHVYCGEMHAFEQGFLIVEPNYLFGGSMGLLVGLPLIGLLGLRRRRDPTPQGGPAGDLHPSERPVIVNLFERWPRLRGLLATQGLQFWLMSVMSVLAYVILLTSLLGTKMAGGNLGVLLLWVVWLFVLVVVFVPLGGRVWCTVCPIPMFGDAIQRGATVGVRTVGAGGTGGYRNRFFGLMRPWPRRLSNRVPRTLFFLGFGTVSVLVISQPRWTGWALVLLMLLATLLPLVFELRAFCRFLCPINSFISLYAPMGRLALRSQRQNVCHRCHERDLETCHKGNDCGWACPYGLTVSEIDSNAECGLCLECLRTCSYRNVSLTWRPFGLQRLVEGRDEALQAGVMMTLAVVYCVTFLGPWHALRDMVNVVDKNNWDLFAVYTASLWIIALGLVPSLMAAVTALGARAAGVSAPLSRLVPRNTSPLVPLGLFTWMAFAVQMFMVEGSFVLSTLSDPFGWGWNLFGTAGHPWKQLWPEAIPWIQACLVLIGAGAALKTARRVWAAETSDDHRMLRGMTPVAALLLAVTGGILWFVTA